MIEFKIKSLEFIVNFQSIVWRSAWVLKLNILSMLFSTRRSLSLYASHSLSHRATAVMAFHLVSYVLLHILNDTKKHTQATAQTIVNIQIKMNDT